MKPLTHEWVTKAEGDYASAGRESRARRNPNYDSLCFHSQQCAEKYLKARLCEAGVEPPRTHDLRVLLTLTLPYEPLWGVFREDLVFLSAFAVRFRYPGDSSDKKQGLDAFR